MNSSPQKYSAAIDEQAAYWAARLDGDILPAKDRAELDAWLAQSPSHRLALSEYCQFSTDLEEQLPQLVASGAVKMPVAAAPRAVSRWGFLRLSGLAVAAAAVALGLWILRPANAVENFAAAIGERSAHTLGDGTRVELNADTTLRFEMSARERRALLAGGEAIFMVTKDPSRPFFVETPAGLVRVTGTTFNVRADPAAAVFEVTVVEGSVEVRPAEVSPKAESAFALTANDQLTATRGQVDVKALSVTALENALAWRRGQIVLDDMPLREAAARFAHYHGRAITVAPEVADERIGGQYALDDLKGFLAALDTALPGVKVSYDTNGAATIGRR